MGPDGPIRIKSRDSLLSNKDFLRFSDLTYALHFVSEAYDMFSKFLDVTGKLLSDHYSTEYAERPDWRGYYGLC